MKNTKLIILIAVVVVALGVGFSYYTFHKALPQIDIKDSPFSVYLQDNKETFVENTEWYEAKVEFPKNNQKVRDAILAKWNDFEKENQLKTYKNFAEAKEGLQLNVEGMKYTFTATYKLVQGSSTVSYVYQIYSFTGGAHGATVMFAMTFNENLEVISAERILPSSSLEKVSALAYDDLVRQKTERMRSYPMTDKEIKESLKDNSWLMEGTAPTRDNYSVVWQEGANLVISFGQYQVGPYVEGIYEVKIPLTSIN